MTIPSPIRVACVAVMATMMGVPPALAQDFSPHFPTTGRGAYDLYRNTVLCGVVLEQASEGILDDERRSLLDKGIRYTAEFAPFLLDTGNVVDGSGTVLTQDHLPVARNDARAAWQAVLLSLEEKGDSPDAEIERCLRRYGHDW